MVDEINIGHVDVEAEEDEATRCDATDTVQELQRLHDKIVVRLVVLLLTKVVLCVQVLRRRRVCYEGEGREKEEGGEEQEKEKANEKKEKEKGEREKRWKEMERDGKRWKKMERDGKRWKERKLERKGEREGRGEEERGS